MKISLNWLQDYIDIPKDTEQVAQLLTKSGLEVSGIKEFDLIPGGLKGLLIGQVMDCYQHPNADNLKITKIDIGKEATLQIICGAPNVQTGQKVVVAPVGTKLYDSNETEFKIKKSKIRGELSEGMLCAEDEIGLGNNHEGIIVLNTALPCGAPAAQHFDRSSDVVLDIDLTPNRGDACSHLGVARELKALLNRSIKYPPQEIVTSDNTHLPISVEVLMPTACPRYTGVVISNVTVTSSPTWLTDRLRAIGLKPINNVVDVTNFVTHELGQPLHAYDYDRIDGKTIKVQQLPKNFSLVTLDGLERSLAGTELMICDETGGIGIAGVMGGRRTEIDSRTKNIFLESAYFLPSAVRAAAKQHALQTDASFRYERGTDPNLTFYALQRACLLIKKIAGGNVASDFVDIYPKKIEPNHVKVRYQYIARLLGHLIPQKTIQQILQRLEIVIKYEDLDGFTVAVPPYRTDVTREVDVIEEIARIYGYEHIEAKNELGSAYLARQHTTSHQIKNEISSLLAANEYHEICTNSLTKSSYSNLLNQEKTFEGISVANPLSESLSHLRQHLLFSGLEVVAYNLNRKQKDLKLFEFGKIYYQENQRYVESDRLGLWLTGKLSPVSWKYETKEATFHDLKGIVYKVLSRLGIANFITKPFQNDLYQSGIKILKGQDLLLTAGYVSQRILLDLHISQPLFFADIHWNNLLDLQKPPGHYQRISKFPSVKRDVSLVLDKSVTFEAVKEIIDQQDGQFIQDVTVFDIYEGKELGANKKAYALSFILQGKEKTLDEKTIDRIMRRFMHSLETNLGATIRI